MSHQYNGYPVQRVPEQTNKKPVKYREASGNKPASDTAGALTSLSPALSTQSVQRRRVNLNTHIWHKLLHQ
jgi:hypothetical protein